MYRQSYISSITHQSPDSSDQFMVSSDRQFFNSSLFFTFSELQLTPRLLPCVRWRLVNVCCSVVGTRTCLVLLFFHCRVCFLCVCFSMLTNWECKVGIELLLITSFFIAILRFREDSLRRFICCFCMIGYVGLSIIHRTLTWTTWSLTWRAHAFLYQ